MAQVANTYETFDGAELREQRGDRLPLLDRPGGGPADLAAITGAEGCALWVGALALR